MNVAECDVDGGGLYGCGFDLCHKYILYLYLYLYLYVQELDSALWIAALERSL